MRRDSEGLLDAVVVGAGSAGLSVSYHLDALGCDHRVIDRGRIGETWRTQRWDTFRLNSPHLCSMLPGDAYEGPDPWGALTRHEFVAYLEDYVERLRLPVETGVTVRTSPMRTVAFASRRAMDRSGRVPPSSPPAI